VGGEAWILIKCVGSVEIVSVNRKIEVVWVLRILSILIRLSYVSGSGDVWWIVRPLGSPF
jgi:hypothetical protein